jgi:hypothetical protein
MMIEGRQRRYDPAAALAVPRDDRRDRDQIDDHGQERDRAQRERGGGVPLHRVSAHELRGKQGAHHEQIALRKIEDVGRPVDDIEGHGHKGVDGGHCGALDDDFPHVAPFIFLFSRSSIPAVASVRR